ncbi:Hypothetical predicted protein [Mytilus galloprovincialis]|uniref:Uncharacterized protein n=1 Tax=Mytilus galloprovincialis TaxID=29158 RepID=A0A8B6HQG6_MYTGA|nr:Hypothetical predicted protein [Mytilus galloprovincialis]
MPSSSNLSNRTYVLSKKQEASTENISTNDVVVELEQSTSTCRGCAFQNEEEELEIIIEEVLPINKKARPKAAKGTRTSMTITDSFEQDITLPGEVLSSNTNLPLTSITLLTVLPIKSVQQMNMDKWMNRHLND